MPRTAAVDGTAAAVCNSVAAGTADAAAVAVDIAAACSSAVVDTVVAAAAAAAGIVVVAAAAGIVVHRRWSWMGSTAVDSVGDCQPVAVAATEIDTRFNFN